MFPIFIHFDLNGTVVVGDEMGGKSPLQSILTDCLESYQVNSPLEFVSNLHITNCNALLERCLGVPVNLLGIIQKNLHLFSHTNFYDNFKTVLELAIKNGQSKIKLNELIRPFLDVRDLHDHGFNDTPIAQILVDQRIVNGIKITLDDFQHRLDKHHIVHSLPQFAESIKEKNEVHLTLNTFGNEAHKVIKALRPHLPIGPAFNVADELKTSRVLSHDVNSTLTQKIATARILYEAAKNHRLITQQSDFHHYDQNGRKNCVGKLLPIDSSTPGLHVFYDDNLTHGGLQNKGCVNIFDLALSQDVDFNACQNITPKEESNDIKAVIHGKAIIVLVKARLANTSQPNYFIDMLDRYKKLADQYLLKNISNVTDQPNPHRLFSHSHSSDDLREKPKSFTDTVEFDGICH